MIVTREIARVAIVTKLETLAASCPGGRPFIEVSNLEKVNRSTQKEPYVSFDIRYTDSDQVNLGPKGRIRRWGNLVVEVWAKAGTGSKRQNEILEHFGNGFQMDLIVGPVHTYAGAHVSGNEKDGWVPEAVIITFWYDTDQV